MRSIFFIFLIVIMTSPTLAAGGSKAQRYRIIPDKEGNLSVKTATKELKGKLQERKGIYSRWQFGDKAGQTPDDFEIIVNDRTKKLLIIGLAAEAGGPSILNASPPPYDYVVLDYGMEPSGRNFEIRNTAGKIVFKDKYFLNNLIWLNSNYVIYPQSLGPSDKPKEIKQCEQLSGSNIVVWLGYDLKTKKKTELNIPRYMECSN